MALGRDHVATGADEADGDPGNGGTTGSGGGGRRSDDERAERAAARLLARRAHGRVELEERLTRSAGGGAATRMVERLERADLIDDARFACERAEERLRRGWGPAAIAADLAGRGVAAEVVADAIAMLAPEAIEEAARAAVRGRPPLAAVRLLAARGFDDDLVERIVDLPEALDGL